MTDPRFLSAWVVDCPTLKERNTIKNALYKLLGERTPGRPSTPYTRLSRKPAAAMHAEWLHSIGCGRLRLVEGDAVDHKGGAGSYFTGKSCLFHSLCIAVDLLSVRCCSVVMPTGASMFCYH